MGGGKKEDYFLGNELPKTKAEVSLSPVQNEV